MDKALTVITGTGYCAPAILEWTGFDEVNKTWSQFKAHFEEAYVFKLAADPKFAGTGMYHSADKMLDIDDYTIGDTTNLITNMHLANNTNENVIG